MYLWAFFRGQDSSPDNHFYRMILRYRVSLPGLKGFARVYELKSTSSLYSFHKKMHADMDFPMDQIVLFKAVNPDGSAIARYSVQNMGKGTIDEVTLGECHKRGEDSFVYFYDTTNRKSVLVNCEGEVAERSGAVYPELVETKGPNPVEFENGYVAYEDLPEDKKRNIIRKEEGNWDDEDDFDDEEDDEDDGDEDKDEEDVVYDENEGNEE